MSGETPLASARMLCSFAIALQSPGSRLAEICEPFQMMPVSSRSAQVLLNEQTDDVRCYFYSDGHGIHHSFDPTAVKTQIPTARHLPFPGSRLRTMGKRCPPHEVLHMNAGMCMWATGAGVADDQSWASDYTPVLCGTSRPVYDFCLRIYQDRTGDRTLLSAPRESVQTHLISREKHGCTPKSFQCSRHAERRP
jgi:hypothetical protein